MVGVLREGSIMFEMQYLLMSFSVMIALMKVTLPRRILACSIVTRRD